MELESGISASSFLCSTIRNVLHFRILLVVALLGQTLFKLAQIQKHKLVRFSKKLEVGSRVSTFFFSWSLERAFQQGNMLTCAHPCVHDTCFAGRGPLMP